jgi:hypothetical protein
MTRAFSTPGRTVTDNVRFRLDGGSAAEKADCGSRQRIVTRATTHGRPLSPVASLLISASERP